MKNIISKWSCKDCKHTRQEHSNVVNGISQACSLCKDCRSWNMRYIKGYPCECGHLKGQHGFRSVRGYLGQFSFCIVCVKMKHFNWGYVKENIHTYCPMESLNYLEWKYEQRTK